MKTRLIACLITLPLIVLMLIVQSVNAQTPDPKAIEFFEQKIRPVLAQHCYSCHSEEARNAKKLKAKLYLDSAEGMLDGGESGPVMVKGKGAESLLVKALKYDGLEMPPSGKLPEEVIADFVKWIDMGAVDPRVGRKPGSAKREINLEEGRQFWSFKPLQNAVPPDVKNVAWNGTPIDRFVAAKHEEKQLKANVPVSKEKLIRRAYFDLIGLPPTPEQVDAFVKDAAPNAFEKVVDELLQSERYGERWGRHWLDVARFAESGGYEFDGFRPGAYHYRDWLIRAINGDMPYSEFVRMQIAGDKLLPDDYRGAAATGFLVAGPYPGQITAKTVERIRYDQLDDMIMTIGGSMLGLTLGCVRCHEHKYDPIPAKDYYGIASSLARSAHGPKMYDPDPAATQRAVEKHRAEHEPFVAALRKFAAEELPKRFAEWQKNELGKQPDAPRWQVLDPVSAEAERSWLKMLPAGVVAHDGSFAPETNAKRRPRAPRELEEYTITAHTFQKNLTSLRLDAFTDKVLPQRGPGLNGDGSFQLAELKVTARPIRNGSALESQATTTEKPIELKLKPVFAAFEDKNQPLANAVDGKPATAWVVRENARKDNAAIFEIEGGLPGFASGTELTFELSFRDLGLGRVRLAMSTEANPATWAGDVTLQHIGEIRATLAANNNQIPESVREPLVHWFSPFDSETAKVFNTVRDHVQREPRPPLTEVYTTIAGGQDVFLLRRGEVDNKQGKAEPSFIQVLATAPDSDARWLPKPAAGQPAIDPRVGLANWMTDVDQGAGVLLARVMVNRLWQHHFGEGIVGTSNDFGAQGERPTHPELLEWLATEFVKGGWRLKPLHKAMMLTAAYQQANEVSADNVKIDPDNRFLWHHKPQRLEAEIIRDAVLAVGGSLDLSMFGPSILDNTPRRSVYLRVKRSELIPFMTMFDAPEPTQSIGERVSTTLPTQALTMMNSPFVRQQAEKLAVRVRPNNETPLESAVDRAYQFAFARQPSKEERDRMVAFINQQVAAKTDLKIALAEVCQVLICLNEFVYVD
ncbi:MAG: PSD1 and planctomycete cytochrome C domain-containing protein [Planctomycetia bacterium]|nr:PSD1 and planctomycete cytochrome C domain-containing protein [Planctomycetia bacterium]